LTCAQWIARASRRSSGFTAHATGQAGDVYLCHPFLVHTATWPHRGTMPRMLAQPAIHIRDGFNLDGSDPSPVAQAIITGLAMAN
jgi:hypothetical protein